ncbi:MAG: glycosyl hydrolase, partial [Mycobacterium sp.]
MHTRDQVRVVGRPTSRRRATCAVLGILAVLAASLVTGQATASPGRAPTSAPSESSATVPDLTAKSFANPPVRFRPKYYWWMPLANTDDAQLRAEIQAMAQAGAGGALITPQGTNDKDPAFLIKYGWGTPTWKHRVEVMLQAAKANGIELDFSQGPRWPALVPTVTDVNDPRAMQQLVYSYELDGGGTTRSGPLPDNYDLKPPAGGDIKLISVLAVRCADSGCHAADGSPVMLDRDSMVDLTSSVDESGNLRYTLPGDKNDTYAVMAFYQTPTGQKRTGLTATSPNYYLDYLSVAGVKATTDYFDKHILTPPVQKLVAENGGAGFYENSLEIGNSLKWTAQFADQFRKLRGYSVSDALPALTSKGTVGVPSAPRFDFSDGSGARLRHDYLHTVSDLYLNEHLDTLRAWAHQHDLRLRAQAYGPPIDIPAANSRLDVPSGEGLAFGRGGDTNKSITYGHNTIEDMKAVAVGAHMNGTPTVAAECCESRGAVWADTTATGDTANLPKAYELMAGGATRIVWHGFPYLKRSSGAQSHWPGMSYGGNTSFSSGFGPHRDPNWADYRTINDQFARLGLVLSQGKPRFDAAVYLQGFGLDGHGTTGVGHNKLIPDSSAMARDGYTYEYLSPQFLEGDKATYRNGALFSDRSAYHALILNNQATMPIDDAQTILRLAKQGMPVVALGNLPTSTPGDENAAQQDASLQSIMHQLTAQPSVHQVATEADAPAALAQAGVHAAAAHATASSAIVSVRRHTANTDYYYLFNQTPTATDQTLTLTGAGRPYLLDTWTGKISRVTDYKQGSGEVTVPIHLHAHATAVIAVARGNPVFDAVGAPHPVDAPASTARLSPLDLTKWLLDVDGVSPGPSDEPGTVTHT